jgi:predicted dehydrogenase
LNQNIKKLAVVGGATNSAVGYAHFVAARMDRCWELVAGAFSTHEDVNRHTGRLFGVEDVRVYRNLEELLGEEAHNLDAITILTPTPQHARMAIRCLEAGVPVICEKSLGMTSQEAREVEAVRTAKKGFLAVIYNYSGYPMVRELRRMIRAGDLGNLLHFQVEMPQEGYLRTDASGQKPVVQGWRLTDGPVPVIHLDLGVHLHELLDYLTGLDPTEVVAEQSSRGWFGVVDQVTCLCRYAGNLTGQVWFSKTALGHRNGLRLRLYGSKGSAEWFQNSPEELIFCLADGRRQVLDRGMGLPISSAPRYTRFKAGHPAGFIEALGNLYSDIHQSLLKFQNSGTQESDEAFGAPLAIRGLEWLEAIARSAATRTWEKVARV